MSSLASQVFALESSQPKILGVMFYADYCGSCKVLDPKVESVQSELSEAPVLFVKLDHSNDQTSKQAAMLATSMQIGEIYRDQQKASGFMLLVDSDSKKILGKITREMSKAEIKEAIMQSM